MSVLEEARLLVGFEQSDLGKLVALTGPHKLELDALSAPYMFGAQKAWEDAGKTATDFIELVMKNNPNKTLEQILKRPDVQEVLHYPFEQAAATTSAAIKSAWSSGKVLGVQHADEQLAIHNVVPAASKTTDKLLDKLIKDTQKNTVFARTKFLLTLKTSSQDELNSALTKLTNDLGRRGKAGAQFASQRAYSDAQVARLEASAKAAGVKLSKMWVTRFGPGTCKTCAALHGTVVALSAAFPATLTFGKNKAPTPYSVLSGPPRHPNCRCKVVPVSEKMTKQKLGPTPTTLKAYALDWWKKLTS